MTSAHDTANLYERQAFETRRRLNSALDELTDSLTPGRVLDEMMSFARGGGGSFLKGMGKAASNNPIPTLLIGAGLAMFLSGKGRVEFGSNGANKFNGDTGGHGKAANGAGLADRAYGAFDSARDGARRTLHDAESGIASAGRTAADSVASAGRTAADSVASAGHTVTDAVSSAGRAVAGGVSKAGSAAASMFGAAGESIASGSATVSGAASAAAGHLGSGLHAAEGAVGSAAHKAADAAIAGERTIEDWAGRISAMAKEQPLVLAAAGVVIGAAIATLLPKTETEDTLFGETREQLKNAVGDIAQEQYQKATETVSHMVDDVKSAAEQEGLSTQNVSDLVRGAAEKIDRVIGAAGDAAGEAVKEQMGSKQS
jgi:hypothetical protein